MVMYNLNIEFEYSKKKKQQTPDVARQEKRS